MPAAVAMKRTIRDMDIQGKRILMRADFNVPQDAEGAITDDARIRASLPTIQYALEQGAAIVLMSHLGRPKGQAQPVYSLVPVARRLSELLDIPVELADDCIGPTVEQKVTQLKAGEVLLLENVRFHREETENDPAFAQQLARLGDVYVSDAFGSVHRRHASTEGVAHYLPAVAGFLLEKEMKYFEQVLNDPERPFIAILGGSKVSGKIDVINNLLDKVDEILIGGAMAFTFQKAQGIAIGSSRVEEDKLDVARELLAAAQAKRCTIRIPEDNIITDDLMHPTTVSVSDEQGIPDGMEGVDIGPKTRALYIRVLGSAKTVIWNGPVGAFEFHTFHEGTEAIGRFLAEQQDAITTVVGGGDTGAAMVRFGIADQMAHVSTGGGASLAYMEGKMLPGIAALQDAGAA